MSKNHGKMSVHKANNPGGIRAHDTNVPVHQVCSQFTPLPKFEKTDYLLMFDPLNEPPLTR